MNPRRLIATLAAATFVLIPACSGDDTDDAAPTTTDEPETTEAPESTTTEAGSGSDDSQVADALAAGDLALAEDEYQCLADALVEEYGDELALELASDTSSPIPEDKLDAISTMFADCVSAQSYASSVLEGLFEPQEIDDATTTCVAQGMEGELKQIVIESNEGPPATIMVLVDECVSTEVYAEFLVPVMEAMGVEDQADCVATELAADVPFSQFMAETENDEPSAELMAAVSAAAGACGVDI
jgi:hypothetical protein